MKPRIEMLRALIRNQHKLMLAMADYLEIPDGSGLRKLRNRQAEEANAAGLAGIARQTATSGLSCSSGLISAQDKLKPGIWQAEQM